MAFKTLSSDLWRRLWIRKMASEFLLLLFLGIRPPKSIPFIDSLLPTKFSREMCRSSSGLRWSKWMLRVIQRGESQNWITFETAAVLHFKRTWIVMIPGWRPSWFWSQQKQRSESTIKFIYSASWVLWMQEQEGRQGRAAYFSGWLAGWLSLTFMLQ